MKFDQYRRQDAVGPAALMVRGEVSATEVLNCCIERIEAVNPTVKAFVYRQYDSARQAIADGLPDGRHLGADYGREDLLIRLAAQLETASPWFDKTPEI